LGNSLSTQKPKNHAKTTAFLQRAQRSNQQRCNQDEKKDIAPSFFQKHNESAGALALTPE